MSSSTASSRRRPRGPLSSLRLTARAAPACNAPDPCRPGAFRRVGVLAGDGAAGEEGPVVELFGLVGELRGVEDVSRDAVVGVARLRLGLERVGRRGTGTGLQLPSAAGAASTTATGTSPGIGAWTSKTPRWTRCATTAGDSADDATAFD